MITENAKFNFTETLYFVIYFDSLTVETSRQCGNVCPAATHHPCLITLIVQCRAREMYGGMLGREQFNINILH